MNKPKECCDNCKDFNYKEKKPYCNSPSCKCHSPKKEYIEKQKVLTALNFYLPYHDIREMIIKELELKK
jgi:uncharacterized paraquat-inducible protein A